MGGLADSSELGPRAACERALVGGRGLHSLGGLRIDVALAALALAPGLALVDRTLAIHFVVVLARALARLGLVRRLALLARALSFALWLALPIIRRGEQALGIDRQATRADRDAN